MVRGKSAIRVLKMTIFMVVKRDDLLLIGNLLSRVVRFAPSSPIFTIEATCGRRTKISNAFEVVFVIVKEHEYMGGGQATKTVVVYFYAKYTHCSVGWLPYFCLLHATTQPCWWWWHERKYDKLDRRSRTRRRLCIQYFKGIINGLKRFANYTYENEGGLLLPLLYVVGPRDVVIVQRGCLYGHHNRVVAYTAPLISPQKMLKTRCFHLTIGLLVLFVVDNISDDHFCFLLMKITKVGFASALMQLHKSQVVLDDISHQMQVK